MRGLCFFSLSILTQVSSDVFCDVTGFIGHNVTLPCRYDTRAYGMLSFCWGRGTLPQSKCSNTILSSQDGVRMDQAGSRYQLLGRLREGDVSLTILNAQQGDAGVYGCRVEIPGWFNDYKLNTHLVMEEAPVEQPVTQDWILGSHVEQTETWMISTPNNVEVGDPTPDIIGNVPTEGKFRAFLGAGNLARMGVIFFSTIIIILVSIFRIQSKRLRRPRHPNTSAAENFYESIPLRE